MKTIAKILVFCAAIGIAYSLCNTCSALTNLACVANNKFSICKNGLPSTTAIQCPTGTVCTPTFQVCSAEGTVPGSCNRCGACDSNNAFACTSYNTFALCYGTTTPSAVSFTCAGSLVCNVDSPWICVDQTTTGLGGTCPLGSTPPATTTTAVPSTTLSPTCPSASTSTTTTAVPTTTVSAPRPSSSTSTTATTTSVPTTTVSPSRPSSSTSTTATTTTTSVSTTTVSPSRPSSTTSTTATTTSVPTTTVSPIIGSNEYCASLGSIGRYEITTDPNCKEYVLCTLLTNSTWIGNIYECPGSTYFNSASGICGVTVPERCVI